MVQAAEMLLRLGKLRYLFAGTAFALLLGMLCRAAGRLAAPFAQWRVFSGTCRESQPQDGLTALTVEFTDAHQLAHTAAFRSAHPDAKRLHAGDTVQIALRTERFAAGSYPDTLRDAAQSDGDILLRAEQRRKTGIRFLRVLCGYTLLCGGALALFLTVMRLCFPHG